MKLNKLAYLLLIPSLLSSHALAAYRMTFKVPVATSPTGVTPFATPPANPYYELDYSSPVVSVPAIEYNGEHFDAYDLRLDVLHYFSTSWEAVAATQLETDGNCYAVDASNADNQINATYTQKNLFFSVDQGNGNVSTTTATISAPSSATGPYKGRNVSLTITASDSPEISGKATAPSSWVRTLTFTVTASPIVAGAGTTVTQSVTMKFNEGFTVTP